MSARQRSGHGWLAGVVGFALLAAVSCSSGSSGAASNPSGDGQLRVVVAENFWGSLASQLGGDRVTVTSLIASPDTDPHDYEPTAQDARAIASAQYVVFNGVGYDTWAGQSVDANPSSDRKVLEIGKLLGLREGDNPHRWYFPADVEKVINQITADYKALDPADADYFDQQHSDLETNGLKTYKDLLGEIKQRYGGTPVGASESIFEGIADATGLDLKTPASFLTAISEGTDPTAQDKATVDTQIAQQQIKVFVYNRQNSTPDVQALVDAARAAGIEVATVTETLVPADASFEVWQSTQLQQLADALAPRLAGDPLDHCAARRGSACRGGPVTTDDGASREDIGPSAPVVEIRDAAARLGARTIWSAVDLQVRAGSFVAVLGPNGVGKSTLIKAVLGQVPLAAGAISVLGRPAGRSNRDIGYLPQRRAFDAALRVRAVDLVRLGLDGDRWGAPLPRWLRRDRRGDAEVARLVDLVGATAYRAATHR